MGFSDFLLKLLNGIFAVGGLVLIGIGAYVLIEVGEYSVSKSSEIIEINDYLICFFIEYNLSLYILKVLTNDTFNAIPIAIMVFGGFILIMALIGLCGALGNSPCVLKDSIVYI